MKSKGKVLLAFSGGIDSSYAAEKLRREGYTVEALILDMSGDENFLSGAANQAREMDLPFRIDDVRERFESGIIDYFTGEYLRGRTPAPCTLCNPLIKWKHLYETACREGFDRIATGHYFRTELIGGHTYIRKAADGAKDQSYYLWMLPQEILNMALTPMGDVIKNDIKGGGDRKESMGVCFLQGGDYRDFIRARCGEHPSCRPGVVTDSEGRPIGTHEGIAYYTTGQKKGLALPPGYAVTGIDPRTNTLVAGPREELLYKTLLLENFRLAPGYPAGIRDGLRIVIRGFGENPGGTCRITVKEGMVEAVLSEPAFAPAKGQPAVLYYGELVAGGGFICGYR